MELWREEYQEYLSLFDDSSLYQSLISILRGTSNTFSMNRKLMQKVIDSSWVEAIENGLLHVDNVLRQPRKTIEDVEEIVPIALSRKITVESVKHLAQHTDLIQSVDKRTGRITPSKILNIHKEESLLTYENKFVNTLIDRLYIFISTRYEKLAQVAQDEEVYSLGFDTELDDRSGGKMKIEVKLENARSLEAKDRSGFTVWQRVEKLKKAIEGYKGSELCRTLGNNYIRPPVMRTNAIMKNVDLKACLTLWQYIESYDKVGYEINIEDAAVKPKDDFIDDFHKLVILHLLLFRASVSPDQEILGTRLTEHIAPIIQERYDTDLYDPLGAPKEGTSGYIAEDSELRIKEQLPENLYQLFNQIEAAVEIERNYQADKRARLLAARQKAEALERQREEQERIKAARQAELERIKAEKEEQERIVKEMLEKKRAEQEAERAERERLEAERQQLLEEKRKRDEEARIRAEEERKLREEAERIEAERRRLAEEKKLVREELGLAEGVEQTETEEPAMSGDFEDPRAVAAREKAEQQRREKERADAERAQRLKAERQYFESKPFSEIQKEYSRNPLRMLMRLIRHILAVVFGIIPENTDNPDYKKLREKLLAEKAEKQREKDERSKMEVYYRKYAKSFKYRMIQKREDRKFRRKREKLRRSQPRPVYKPPVRTPEEELAIRTEMQRLYKEYHVSIPEKVHRKIEEIKERRAQREKLTAEEKKHVKRGFSVLISVILMILIGFSVYVTVNTARGKSVSIFGNRILRVVTGSMEPALHVEDCIIVRSCEPEELQPGDIISFVSEDPEIYGELVTHRIEAVNADGTFRTRGDANPVADSLAVRGDQIVGKYVRKAGFYKWIGSFADSRKLILVLIMIPMSLMSLSELFSVFRIGKEIKEESEEEAHERRMREAIEKEKARLAAENWQPPAPTAEQEASIRQMVDSIFAEAGIEQVPQAVPEPISNLTQTDAESVKEEPETVNAESETAESAESEPVKEKPETVDTEPETVQEEPAPAEPLTEKSEPAVPEPQKHSGSRNSHKKRKKRNHKKNGGNRH